MKVVRQARLELSGGSTPDQLRPCAKTPSYGAVYFLLSISDEEDVYALCCYKCSTTPCGQCNQKFVLSALTHTLGGMQFCMLHPRCSYVSWCGLRVPMAFVWLLAWG